MSFSAAGLEAMDSVYGAGFSANMAGQSGAFAEETVNRLFADVWNRPGLSIRDRRLLVLGVTAALGRAELIEIQVRGALANEELNAAQLDEMVAFLAYYVGWGNGAEVQRGVSAALAATTTSTEGDTQ